jgi:hypothetical protein
LFGERCGDCAVEFGFPWEEGAYRRFVFSGWGTAGYTEKKEKTSHRVHREN